MTLPLMFGTKQVHILIFFDSFVLRFICYLHRVKYGLDQFFDHFFLDLFFWDHFEGGSTSLLLREGWNEVYQY